MCQFKEAVEDDFEGICRLIRSEEELFRVYPGGHYPLTIDQVRELSKYRKDLTVAMDEVSKVVGFANLYNFEPGKTAFVGNVVIDPDYRGKGLGKAIVSHMLEKVFRNYNLPEVQISLSANHVGDLNRGQPHTAACCGDQ